MISRKILLLMWLFSSVSLAPGPARAQAPAGPGAVGQLGTSRSHEKQEWHIFGRVTTLNGEPVAAAKVKVDIGSGMNSVQTLETNLRGEFRTQYDLNANLYKRLAVNVTATKAGYQEARETVDFGSGDQTWGIDMVMGEIDKDADQLPLAMLISGLAPDLRKAAAGNPALDRVRQDFVRGSEEFLDRRNPVRAVPLLAKVVERRPECIECRTLLGLALLDAGSYASARRHLTEAAKLSATHPKGARSPDSVFALGVLESWGGEDEEAAKFMMQALDLDPNNPLVLQELGRTLIFQKNWEAADQYLERAIKAGASQGARFLRARALLEEGDSEEADAEMSRYLGGRDIKDLPVSARTFYGQLRARLDLRSYAKVKSLVDEPLPKLIEALPELEGLTAAASQESLASILRDAGENVESFLQNFPNTMSSEQIHQERIGKDGKIKSSLDQSLQYLFLARSEKLGMALEEYRTDSRGDPTGLRGLESGFMLTSGFASASLLFHPAYQSGASFRYLGRQLMGGHHCHVVGFAQRPETAQIIERFSADGTRALVLLQGLAWIEEESHRIVRLRTDLLKPLSSIRLQRQTTEIQYDQVQFKELASAMWLPREVAVTVEWKGRTFHNLHRYSEFKLFHVETREKLKDRKSRAHVSNGPN